jgi:hypothetical protein
LLILITGLVDIVFPSAHRYIFAGDGNSGAGSIQQERLDPKAQKRNTTEIAPISAGKTGQSPI